MNKKESQKPSISLSTRIYGIIIFGLFIESGIFIDVLLTDMSSSQVDRTSLDLLIALLVGVIIGIFIVFMVLSDKHAEK